MRIIPISVCPTLIQGLSASKMILPNLSTQSPSLYLECRWRKMGTVRFHVVILLNLLLFSLRAGFSTLGCEIWLVL